MAELQVIPGWWSDETLLSAVRSLFAYGPGENRATGYLKDPGQPWPSTLVELGSQLDTALLAFTGLAYPIVAFQAYRDGAGTGWHTDDPFDAQAVLSLGVPRAFAIRREGQESAVMVHHGDLVVMPSGFQGEWEHRVVPDDSVGERVSLVFRTPRS
jgi:alkylated DNA repair dioxygenase AlkB